MPIPTIRLTNANDHPLRSDGDYVLYWMIANRRTRWNYALQHAVDRARQLKKPLIIFEPLRAGYRWASDRLHRFVIEGMRDNAAALAGRPVTYYPYVEDASQQGAGLLDRLAENACTVVTDQCPSFFLPAMIDAVQRRLPARLEAVDSNGLLPLRLATRTFTVAHSYRRWMQKTIVDRLDDFPAPDPLARLRLPRLDPDQAARLADIQRRWPAADLTALLAPAGLSQLKIDHTVGAGAAGGGAAAGQQQLRRFLGSLLPRYDHDRNHPDASAASGLSPYLHFGHLSAHQIVADLWQHEAWNPSRWGAPNGKNHGFWNTSPAAEAFLDQLLTWREIGLNMAFREPRTYDRFESLPAWAQQTLQQHGDDPRPHLYRLEQFEAAQTHDPLWNAAQRQLLREGRMHNYLRMLWGKKILHWTRSPQQALRVMIQLNNKYALDGRDANSYSGIFWVLGRYDRPWGPRRPVFGTVRYMSSDSARRKLRLDGYLQRYAADR